MMYRTKCQLFASVLTILLLSQDVIGLQCPGRYLHHGYATMCETESAAADPAEVQSCLTKAIADTSFTCNTNDACMEVNIQIDPGFFSDTDNRIWSYAACYTQSTLVLLCSEDRVGTTVVGSSTQSGSSAATSTEVTSTEAVTTTEEPTTSTEAPTTSTATTSTATTSTTSGPSTTSTASTSTATTSTATTSTATTSTATTSTATTSTSTTTASTSTASTSTQSTTTGPSTSTSTVVTTTTTTDAPTTTSTTTEAPTTSQATTSDAPSVGSSSTEAGSTTTDTVLPMFEGCIYVDPINFGAAACADGNTEVKAVGMVANSTLNGMLHPTVNITATLLGCCTEENCRVDDGVTRDKTCSFGSGTDVVDVECEGACYAYLKINGGTTTAMRGCLKDLDLTDSTFSNVNTCQHKDGTCTDTASAKECLRCCTDDKCNSWTTEDELLGSSASSSVSTSVLTLLVCSLLAIKLN